MKKITVREFRNQFCKLYKSGEAFVITNRGKVVGTYNPSIEKPLCESKKFSGKPCVNYASYFVRAVKEGAGTEGRLCNDCYQKIKVQENNDPDLTLEERML